MKNIKIALATLTFLISSCIEEYKMPTYAANDFEPELVIQGYILSNDESLVYLSMTEPVYNESDPIPITNAKVNIIGQNGYESKTAEYQEERDCYVIDTEELSQETLYALKVELDGKIYQSDFLHIIDTPEIDEVTYKEHENGISIHVSTYAKSEDSNFYMWSFEEDWEFHSEYDLRWLGGIPIYNHEKYPLEDIYKNPYYYCWGHKHSSEINIYRTDNLKENSVKDVKIQEIPIDDIRISYIYSILVKQHSLTPEAYNYYKTLELYTENTGGLFPPMPSDLRGNVSCISNPDIKIRGYVHACNVTTKRIFIKASEFKEIVPEYQNCVIDVANASFSGWQLTWLNLINKGYVASTPNGALDKNSKLYSPECVDCRSIEGATKKRPDFWPNNHE